MTRLGSRWREEDEGLGMVLVLLTTLVVGLFLIVISNTVTAGLRERVRHTAYEQALDASETGIDAVLGVLDAHRRLGIGPDVPSSVATAGGFTSPGAEKAWVTATISGLVASGQVVPAYTPTGEYVAIRPASLNTVYSMGWSPSRAKATRTRLLKVDFANAPSPAPGAILTNGYIDLSGSFDVSNAPGVTAAASVHTNSSLNSNASSVSVSGPVTATGTNNFPGGTPGAPLVDVPPMDPAAFYDSQVATYAAHWYDLCPDGQVHRGSATGGPCSNPATVNLNPDWTFNGGAWTENHASVPGVFYAYKADAIVSTNGETVDQTIVTESSANRQCPAPTNGNVSVSKTTVRGFVAGTVLLSGNNLSMTNNSAAYGGLVGAQGSVTMQTSSAPGVRGYIIAENLCPGSANSFQGSAVVFDPGYAFVGRTPLQVLAESELTPN